jgi:hypothetical protein
MKDKIIIGIDPAFRIKGFSIAIIDYSDRTVNFKTFKNGFIDFSSWLLHDSPESAVVCVENSNLQKATFDMTGKKSVLAQKSRSVGKNQAISQITYDICKVFDKFDTYQISPREKGKKWNNFHFKGVLKAERLSITIPADKVTQDEIDGLQIALHGKRLSMRPKINTINQNIKLKTK